jgi:hypothetical protein
MVDILSANTAAIIGQWTPDSGARIGALLEGLPTAMAALALPETRRSILSAAIVALDQARESGYAREINTENDHGVWADRWTPPYPGFGAKGKAACDSVPWLWLRRQ